VLLVVTLLVVLVATRLSPSYASVFSPSAVMLPALS
jgi:hypothetical protein